MDPGIPSWLGQQGKAEFASVWKEAKRKPKASPPPPPAGEEGEKKEAEAAPGGGAGELAAGDPLLAAVNEERKGASRLFHRRSEGGHTVGALLQVEPQRPYTLPFLPSFTLSSPLPRLL